MLNGSVLFLSLSFPFACWDSTFQRESCWVRIFWTLKFALSLSPVSSSLRQVRRQMYALCDNLSRQRIPNFKNTCWLIWASKIRAPSKLYSTVTQTDLVLIKLGELGRKWSLFVIPKWPGPEYQLEQISKIFRNDLCRVYDSMTKRQSSPTQLNSTMPEHNGIAELTCQARWNFRTRCRSGECRVRGCFGLGKFHWVSHCGIWGTPNIKAGGSLPHALGVRFFTPCKHGQTMMPPPWSKVCNLRSIINNSKCVSLGPLETLNTACLWLSPICLILSFSLSKSALVPGTNQPQPTYLLDMRLLPCSNSVEQASFAHCLLWGPGNILVYANKLIRWSPQTVTVQVCIRWNVFVRVSLFSCEWSLDRDMEEAFVMNIVRALACLLKGKSVGNNVLSIVFLQSQEVM